MGDSLPRIFYVCAISTLVGDIYGIRGIVGMNSGCTRYAPHCRGGSSSDAFTMMFLRLSGLNIIWWPRIVEVEHWKQRVGALESAAR